MARPVRGNPIRWIDITIKEADAEVKQLQEAFGEHCKSWAFQLEEGKGGYRHYQCRIVLHDKARLHEAKARLKLPRSAHLSPTNGNCRNFLYVEKPDGRLAGPWSHKDGRCQWLNVVRDQERPWQREVGNFPYDRRLVHFIYDPNGGAGKSTFAQYHSYRFGAVYITGWNDPKEVVQSTFAQVSDNQDEVFIILDLPRVRLSRDKFYELFNNLESIKNGCLQEYRYKFQRKFIGRSRVVVFSNWRIERDDRLSADRWRLYELTGDYELVEALEHPPDPEAVAAHEDLIAAQERGEAYGYGEQAQWPDF